MPVIKIRFSTIVKKVKIEPFLWDNLKNYIEEAFLISLSSHKLSCTKPISCAIKTQTDLDALSEHKLLEIEIMHNDESVYSQTIRELLDMPSNREYMVKKFVDVMRQYPSTSLDALIPNNLELSIKEKLIDLYRDASARTERKNAFKLVYVKEGGKNVLKGMPTSQWINYSTTDFEALSRSLPPNVIEKLNMK